MTRTPSFRSAVAFAIAFVIALLSAPAAFGAPDSATASTTPVPVRLTLADAVRLALERDATLASARTRPLAAEAELDQALGWYEPTFEAGADHHFRRTSATTTAGTGTTADWNTASVTAGLSQPLRTGGSLALSLDSRRQSLDEGGRPDAYQSVFGARLEQPLLRGFSTDEARTRIRVSRLSLAAADAGYRGSVADVTAEVKWRFHELVAARELLAAERENLALAVRLAEDTRGRAAAGAAASVDLVDAEAEIAARREGVLRAETAVADAEDRLRVRLAPDRAAVDWRSEIIPVDGGAPDSAELDVEAALRAALAQRSDLAAARSRAEAARARLGYAKNQALPQLDAFADLRSYGSRGAQMLGSDGVPVGPLGSSGTSGDALRDAFGFDEPEVRAGVRVALPVLNRQASALRAQAEADVQGADATASAIEMQIAADVRAAARAVESARARVAAASAARTLAVRRVELETGRYRSGLSTAFLVTQAQRDLALARSAEISATTDWRKSVAEFDRVQVAGR